MSIDFSQYRHLAVPEGEVQSITDGAGREIWRRRYVDRVPLSIGSDGKVYNGQGWKKGVRLSGSSGGERDYENAAVTGFISVKSGDVIQMRYAGENPYLWETLRDHSHASSWVYYDINFVWLGSVVPVQGSQYGICTKADWPTGGLANGNLLAGIVPSNSKIAYMRLSTAIAPSGYNAAGNWVTFDQSLEPLIVTVNEEIDD